VAEAGALVPRKEPGAFNGALMELGAILCTPRAPNCLLCPVRKHCGAYLAGTVEVIPRKKPRRKTVLLAEPCAWIARKDRILLEQQTGSRWRGLWKLRNSRSLPAAPPRFSRSITHSRIIA
jgi:A/G-specific adenine glycosylase